MYIRLNENKMLCAACVCSVKPLSQNRRSQHIFIHNESFDVYSFLTLSLNRCIKQLLYCRDSLAKTSTHKHTARRTSCTHNTMLKPFYPFITNWLTCSRARNAVRCVVLAECALQLPPPRACVCAPHEHDDDDDDAIVINA